MKKKLILFSLLLFINSCHCDDDLIFIDNETDLEFVVYDIQDKCKGRYQLNDYLCDTDEIIYSEGDFIEDIKSYFYKRDDCDDTDVFKTYITVTIIPKTDSCNYTVKLIDDISGREIKTSYKAYETLCFDKVTKEVYIEGPYNGESLNGINTIQFELKNFDDELKRGFQVYEPKLIVSGDFNYDVEIFLQHWGNTYGYELTYNKSSFYKLTDCNKK